MSEENMRFDDGGGRERVARVDYPSNSKKEKDAPADPKNKNVTKVTVGEVVTRKKPLGSRIRSTFVNENSQNVGQYVLLEVLIPAAKNMLSDAISQGIEKLLFGDSRPRGSTGSRPGYTSYNKMARSPGSPGSPIREINRRDRANHDFDDIVLSTRGEAEEVLDRLRDLVDEYEIATVADLYDLVGISSSFTDNKWGWYDLKHASVRNIRGGYLVVLPRTQPID
jgi:hypothetical protein